MADVTLVVNAGSYLTTGSNITFSIVTATGGDGGGGAGGGASRGRMIRKFGRRKREDEGEPVAQSAPQPIPKIPQIPQPPPLPPQPGLLAGIPMPPLTVLRSPKVENDDDEAIALLLELLS